METVSGDDLGIGAHFGQVNEAGRCGRRQGAPEFTFSHQARVVIAYGVIGERRRCTSVPARTHKYRRCRTSELGRAAVRIGSHVAGRTRRRGNIAAIVAAAVINIPDADYAAINLVTPGAKVSTPAFSDSRVERLQELTNQGPCLSTAREHRTFRTDDLRTQTRWPLFARRAADLGVRSMLSFQLYVQKENLGALNLYGRQPDAFGDGDEDIGLLFAGHAAVALIGAQHQHHSDLALTGRDIIGQAKGILMERYKIGADQAFTVLVRASQASNRKLSDIAHVLADTGKHPPI